MKVVFPHFSPSVLRPPSNGNCGKMNYKNGTHFRGGLYLWTSAGEAVIVDHPVMYTFFVYLQEGSETFACCAA